MDPEARYSCWAASANHDGQSMAIRWTETTTEIEREQHRNATGTTPTRPPSRRVPIDPEGATWFVSFSSANKSTSSVEEASVQQTDEVAMRAYLPMLPQERSCNVDLYSTDDDGSASSERTSPDSPSHEHHVDEAQHEDVSKKSNGSPPDQHRGEPGRQRWDDKFNSLVQHLEKCKRWPEFSKHGILYSWVNAQQVQREEGKLLRNRFEQLDKLGFPWTGTIAGVPYRPHEPHVENGDDDTIGRGGALTREDMRSLAWEEKFRSLVQYLDEHNTWPTFSTHVGLYNWIVSQRKRRSLENLEKENLERLDELGFPWTGTIAGAPYRPYGQQTENGDEGTMEMGVGLTREDMRSRVWDAKFSKLVQHLNEHKTWPTSSNGKTLYGWIQGHRQQLVEETLPEDKFKKLDELGFPWIGAIAGVPYRPPGQQPENDHEDHAIQAKEGNTQEQLRSQIWNEQFSSLVRHLNQHRKWPTSPKHRVLYSWVDKQRDKHHVNKLSQDKFERLDELGCPWEEKLSSAPYRPRGQQTDNRGTEATKKRDGTALEELRDRAWIEKFNSLIQHLEKCKRWPSFGKHKKLYHWVYHQRNRLDEGKMSDNQFKQLDELGFPWEGKIAGHPYNPPTVPQEEATNDSSGDCQNTDHHDGGPSGNGDEMVHSENDKHHGTKHNHQRDANSSTRGEDRRGKRWEEQFSKLLAHLDAHQEWPTKSEYRSLNNWLSTQRKHKRENQLSSERFERLDNLGFPWEGDLSGVPYCSREAQSNEEQSTTNEHDGDDNGEGNHQRQTVPVSSGIHPAATNCEGEHPATPMEETEAKQTDGRKDSTTSRKRKRMGTGL